MEKDYVLDHDWGDYNSDDTVNKLMLRNADDFMKYFDKEIQNQFVLQKRGYRNSFVIGFCVFYFYRKRYRYF